MVIYDPGWEPVKALIPGTNRAAAGTEETHPPEAAIPETVEQKRAFAHLVALRKDALMAEWRHRVLAIPQAAKLDKPTLNDMMPRLLDQLVGALSGHENPSVLDVHRAEAPKLHGLERLHAGYDIVEVVAEYSILQELVFELGDEQGLEISGETVRVITRLFGRATAAAVDTYSREKTVEIQQKREEHFSFVVHDLRTPLAAMDTAVRVLTHALPQDIRTGQVAKMLGILERNAQRLSALLKRTSHDQQRIMLATQGTSPERREFDLWPLVERLLADLEPVLVHPEVRIVNAVPEDLMVFADSLMLSQIFQNLISNALRYTTRGEIRIGAAQIEGGHGHSARCWVADTGSGIEPHRLGRIFEKLESDRLHEGGLGLGLSIVKQLVEAHGGGVTVDSEVGRGSTFFFTLPDDEAGQVDRG